MDKVMLRAATFFSITTVIGTMVSFKEDVPGEPFGHKIQWSILKDPLGRIVGGSGISAPWAMPAGCVAASVAARSGQQWPGRVVAGIAAAFTIGQLMEPAAWGRRGHKPAVCGMVVLNMVTTVTLFTSVRRRSRKQLSQCCSKTYGRC